MRAPISALLVAVALTGCGSDDEREVLHPLAEAATATMRESTAQLTFTVVEHGDGKPAKTLERGSGFVRFAPRRMRLLRTYFHPRGDFAIEQIDVDRKSYVRLGSAGFQNWLGWVVIDTERVPGSDLLTDVEQAPNPAASLDALRRMAHAKAVGHETIDGVRTTRYRGRMVGPKAERQPVDVWLDAGMRLRRFRWTSRHESTRASLTMTLGYSNFGATVPALAPPKDARDVTDEVAAYNEG